MYSRYSDFSIPKNYSGSRFSSIDDTSTKLHRGEIGGASKSSHSPTFIAPRKDDEIQSENDELSESFDENYTVDINESVNDSTEVACEVSKPKDDKQDLKSAFDFSSIKSLFSSVDKDELIILGLILLLISDAEQENEDVIALLVMLLLSGKI